MHGNHGPGHRVGRSLQGAGEVRHGGEATQVGRAETI